MESWFATSTESNFIWLGWVAMLDAAVKGAVLLILAGGLAVAMRRASAAARHLIWTSVMAAMLFLPFVSSVAPAWEISVLPNPSRSAASLASGPTEAIEPMVRTGESRERHSESASIGSVAKPEMASSQASQSFSAEPGRYPVTVPPSAIQSSVVTPPIDAKAVPTKTPISWWALATICWGAGAVILLLPLLAGVCSVERLAHRHAPETEGALHESFLQAVARTGGEGILRRVSLRVGKEIPVPMSAGLFRPSVYLPAEAREWPQDRLAMVLLHELAHIQRLDLWTQLLAQLARAVYWFNPLVWIAARRMRIERERACDDAALNAGARASDYAEFLLNVARKRQMASASSYAVTMATPTQIEHRILAILNPNQNRNSLKKSAIIAALTATFAIVLPLASLRATTEKAETISATVAQATDEATKEEKLIAQADTAAPGATGGASGDTASTPSTNPPKIGVIFSAYTAETPPPDLTEFGSQLSQWVSMTANAGMGYYFHNLLIPALRSLGFEVYAVVEPGTADKGQLGPLLQRLKLTDRVIDGTDPAALKQLDVIASLLAFSLKDEVFAAIREAVHEGVGFTCVGLFGTIHPGNTDEMQEFLGIDQSMANFRSYEKPMTLNLVAPQEFRTGYFNTGSQVLNMGAAYGFTGVVDGTPLVMLPSEVDDSFCPMWVRQYGKGRVFVYQLTIMPNTSAINMMSLRTLGQYALNWSAGRKMDTNWRALQVASASTETGVTEAASTGPEAVAPAAPGNTHPPKVGMILHKVGESRTNFEHPGGGDYFGNLMNVLAGFEMIGYVTYAIPDPGAPEDPKLAELIDGAALRDRVINADDPVDLGKLDVIVSSFNSDLSTPILTDILAAVRAGAGFIAHGEIGAADEEGRHLLESLIGIDPDPSKISVVPGEHLGKVIGRADFAKSEFKPDDNLKYWHAVGYQGKPSGDVLIESADSAVPFPPVYTMSVGNGRVLVVQSFLMYPKNAAPLMFVGTASTSAWNEGLNWAASRPIETRWAPDPKVTIQGREE